jgi:hypothetical protein
MSQKPAHLRGVFIYAQKPLILGANTQRFRESGCLRKACAFFGRETVRGEQGFGNFPVLMWKTMIHIF